MGERVERAPQHLDGLPPPSHAASAGVKSGLTRHTYDAALDGILSWALAISEIRRRGVIAGRFIPLTNDERTLALRAGR